MADINVNVIAKSIIDKQLDKTIQRFDALLNEEMYSSQTDETFPSQREEEYWNMIEQQARARWDKEKHQLQILLSYSELKEAFGNVSGNRATGEALLQKLLSFLQEEGEADDIVIDPDTKQPSLKYSVLEDSISMVLPFKEAAIFMKYIDSNVWDEFRDKYMDEVVKEQ